MDVFVKHVSRTLHGGNTQSAISGHRVKCLVRDNRLGSQIVILWAWYDRAQELLERKDWVWSVFLSLAAGTMAGTERCPIRAC